MVRRHYRLPSLTTLAVFEAAARQRSVKRAAQELNVTPGAVSRQIRALEEEVGRALFVRNARGLAPTDEGEAFYGVLSRAFGQIAEAFERVKAAEREKTVMIGATTAFASLWLMPRLGGFWRQCPDVIVNHFISDDLYEPRIRRCDLRVRYGGGAWEDEAACRLFGDRIFPVAGADFARAHAECTRPEALAALPLLQLDFTDPEWTGWSEWFARLGADVGRPKARHFNSYVVAVQAALDNQGVLLAWERLLRPLLAEGRLVRVTAAEIDAPGAFYVTWDRHLELSEQAAALRDWLVAEAAAVGGPEPVPLSAG